MRKKEYVQCIAAFGFVIRCCFLFYKGESGTQVGMYCVQDVIMYIVHCTEMAWFD
jgi:hypothetical protein